MTVVRRLARPLLAAPFIATGVDGFRHPGPRVEAARPLATQVARAGATLGVPDDAELLVRANGAVTAAAGILLAAGRVPRLAGTVLAVTGTAAAVLHHPFWTAEDPQTRRDELAAFLRSVGLVGGALLAAVDTQGRPGVAWRSRRAARSAERTAQRAGRQARRATRLARAQARAEGQRLARSARGVLPG